MVIFAFLLGLAFAGSFEVENNTFLLNGTPFQFRSSSLHYFRMRRADWRDRMLRLQSMGMNTIEASFCFFVSPVLTFFSTKAYVAWNLHQPSEEEFDFSGERDVVYFLHLAQELGLYVLLRPGPYICGEWEFGGLPAWLLKIPNLKTRTWFAPWNDAVEKYLAKLYSLLAPLSIQRGGPIIAVQIENEYGSAGNVVNNTFDRQYMHGLSDLVTKYFGPKMLQYTTNPTHAVAAGALYGYGNAIDILDFRPGANLTEIYEIQSKINLPGRAPPAVTEWYPGWVFFFT